MFDILFNEQTSVCAKADNEYNLLYIAYVKSYVNEILKHRGYVYANYIYEHLGVKWNPDWENLCCRYNEKNTHIDFHTSQVEDGIQIHIG